MSLKLYFDIPQTELWAEAVKGLVARRPSVREGRLRVFLLPSLPAIPAVTRVLGGAPISVGAQDLHDTDRGAFTGAVSGDDLRALGCTYVEIGHCERRELFGEGDAEIRGKLRAAVRNGLIPVLCVGESERGSAADAATATLAQLDDALSALTPGGVPDIVVAYEPVWAIGRSAPATRDHVAEVARAIRARLDADARVGSASVIYGGSAKVGTLGELGSSVDGLFLGRFAHDPAHFELILEEAEALVAL